MKSLTQHACDSCNELRDEITKQLERVKAAKRLLSLEEMQCELSAIQIELGSLRDKAQEMKMLVTRAFAVESRSIPSDEIPRTVPAFPTHPVNPPPAHYHEGINA